MANNGVEHASVDSGFTECRTSRSLDSQLDEASLWAASMPTVIESDESMADGASTGSYSLDENYIEEMFDCNDTPYDPISRPKVYKVNENVDWLQTARTFLKPRSTPTENKESWKKHETQPTWVSIADRHVAGAAKKRKESPEKEVFLDPKPTWLTDAKTCLNKPTPVAAEVEKTKSGVWLKTARCSLLPARTHSEENVRASLKERTPGNVGWLLVARKSLAETPTSEQFNPMNQTKVEAMMITADSSQIGEDLLPPPPPASTRYRSSFIGQSTNHDSGFKSNVKNFIDYFYNGSLFNKSGE